MKGDKGLSTFPPKGRTLLFDDPDLSLQELLTIIPGPDFPTGGVVMGRQGIIDGYARGRGRVQITAELPIMYMQGRRSAPPEVYFAADPLLPGEPKRERQSMLERSRYLQSLPVYRYRA